MDDILLNLNEEQLKPVTDTEGQVLVLAGAGSGKTRVLTSRIAYILQKGLAYPSNILAITFTNKAANEMKNRVESFMGATEGMWICTIHSMCVKILRRFGEAIGVRKNFSIYTESERSNVIKKIFKELGGDDKYLKSVKYHIDNAKTLGLDPDQYLIRYKDEADIKLAVEVYARYTEYLEDCNALDFDDLLVRTLRLLRKDVESREYLSDKFKYILVDEFQDTNAVQYSIIRLLAQKHGNLFAVGDDDQSIYGWRGAEIENILRFDKDYPSAKIYKLQRNYRSTKSILALANAVISKNKTRHKKQLWTEDEDGVKPEYVQTEEEKDEALFAAKTINSAVYSGEKYSDFAVLMRINALTRSYEQEFAKYGIPYKVFGGFKFFERKEIKDVLAYLRLISNPFDDEAFTRIINVPRRGIGGKTLEVMESYAKKNSLSLYDACIDVDELDLNSGAKAKIREFSGVVKRLVIASQAEGLSELVTHLMEYTNIRSAYDDHTDEGDTKLANLSEFCAAVADFARLNPEAGLDDYLNQVSLSSDTDEINEGNYVTLATIHSVKGLEFRNVILCGMEDGILPTSRAQDDPAAVEEERRLTYVAITRAEKRLWITRSKSRFLYGERQPTRPSRFIKDMGAALDYKEEKGSSYSQNRYRREGYGNREGYGGYGNRRVYNDESGYSPDGYEGDYWPGGNVKSTYKKDAQYGGRSGSSTESKPQKHFSAASTFGSGTPKPSASQGKYFVGCRVSHPKFGVGMVVSVKNGGAVINVAFEGQGIKELSASLAPLTILK